MKKKEESLNKNTHKTIFGEMHPCCSIISFVFMSVLIDFINSKMYM